VAGGGLTRIAAVARNTFREAVRERVLLNLVLFALLMMVSGLVLRALSVRQDDKIIKDLGLAAMDVIGTMIAIFVGVGLVSKEIERRSLYPLLAKPLTRAEFIVGKFIGLAATLLVNVAAMGIGLLGTLLAIRLHPGARTDTLDLGLLLAAAAIYLGLLLVVALALLFSTLTSSAMAALSTLALVVAGRYSDIIRNMRTLVPEAPQWLCQAVYLALPNFANFDLKHRAVHGQAIGAGELGWIALYAVAYVALVLTAACAVFRARDLK
jgi:ABC-type transport system involved in multi-copper enzyme maturation permease subunit